MQPSLAAGHVEPHRVPAARRLRARDHAVQLHLRSRQPRLRAGDAWATSCSGSRPSRPSCRALGLLRAARGGRPAARRHQPRLRRRPGDRPTSRSTHPDLAGRALHRLDRRLPGHLAHDRRATSRGYRSYPRIVGETGGKDFILAHASADRGGARDGARPRLVRVPGPEVLGAPRAVHPAEPVAHVRERLRDHGRVARGRLRPTSATSSARSSTRTRSPSTGRDRAAPRPRPPIVVGGESTTPSAGSSSRRS